MTWIKYNFNYYEVMVTLLNHICIFVSLYKSINLKMAECRQKYVVENFVKKIHHKY